MQSEENGKNGEEAKKAGTAAQDNVMAQGVPGGQPDDEKTKMSKKQIIGMVVLSLIAICGVLFGVYGMNSQNEQIAQLTVRATDAEGKVAQLETGKITITDPDGGTTEITDSVSSAQNPVISGDESASYDVDHSIRVYIRGNESNDNDMQFYVRDGKLTWCYITGMQGGDCNVNDAPDGIYKMATIYEGNGMGGEKIGFLMKDGTVWYAPIYEETSEAGVLNVKKDMVARKANIDGFVKDIMRINYCSMVTKYCNASTVFVKSDNSVEKYDESMFE